MWQIFVSKITYIIKNSPVVAPYSRRIFSGGILLLISSHEKSVLLEKGIGRNIQDIHLLSNSEKSGSVGVFFCVWYLLYRMTKTTRGVLPAATSQPVFCIPVDFWTVEVMPGKFQLNSSMFWYSRYNLFNVYVKINVAWRLGLEYCCRVNLENIYRRLTSCKTKEHHDI